MIIFWMPLVATFLPFGLWYLEQWLQYPHIIEEMAKGLMLIPVVGKFDLRQEHLYVVLLGLLFAGSEMILAMVPALTQNEVQPLIGRGLLTVPMHLVTILTLYTGWRQKAWVWGLAAAILIHWGFNWGVFYF